MSNKERGLDFFNISTPMGRNVAYLSLLNLNTKFLQAQFNIQKCRAGTSVPASHCHCEGEQEGLNHKGHKEHKEEKMMRVGDSPAIAWGIRKKNSDVKPQKTLNSLKILHYSFLSALSVFSVV